MGVVWSSKVSTSKMATPWLTRVSLMCRSREVVVSHRHTERKLF